MVDGNPLTKTATTGKVFNYGVISGLYFPVFGPEITPYLDAFHTVCRLGL